jgi:hypothetical protein
MTNQDLIRQYVDTGLQIPEYQFNRLSSNNKKTYIRKRLMTFEKQTDAVAPYEMSFIPEDKKQKFAQDAKNRKLFQVSDFDFCFLSPERQKKYFNWAARQQGFYLNEKQFAAMTPENKSIYANVLFDVHAPISDFAFDFLNDKKKNEYLLYRIDQGSDLTDKLFLLLKPELREKYLMKKSRSGYFYPTELQWNLLTPEQKQMLTISKIHQNTKITDREFESLPEKDRKKAVHLMFANRNELSSLQFGFLDDEQKRKYVLSYATTGFGRLGKEFLDQLTPETKAEYEAKMKRY